MPALLGVLLLVAVRIAAFEGAAVADNVDGEGTDIVLGAVRVEAARPREAVAAEEAASAPTVPHASPPPDAAPSPARSDAGGGSAREGYLVENVTGPGPWGEMPVQDTPYTMVVASRELIENRNMSSARQLFKIMPNVYQASQDDRPVFEARGFGSTVLVDGVRQQFASVVGMPGGPADSHVSLFEMERVLVQPGLTGFLSGGGHVGGSVNYVTKRPTDEQFVAVTEGNFGRDQWFTHIDAGGPLASGKFGYRLNLAQINGEGSVKGCEREEYLASLALDWNISDRVRFQINGGAYKRHTDGSRGSFGTFAGTRPDAMIAPPDPGRSYGQEWEYAKSESYKWGANLDAEITTGLRFRSAFLWKNTRRRYLATTAQFSASLPADTDPHDYERWIWDPLYAEASYGKAVEYGGYAYLDYEADTFGIAHKFTLGMNTTVMRAYVPLQNSLYALDAGGDRNIGGNSVAHPQFPRPVQWGGGIGGPHYRVHRNEYTNYVLGDEIHIGDHIIALIGFNRAYVHTAGYLPTGARRSKYERYETTPNYSLVFKPLDNVSVYGTYIESLEDGGMVPLRHSGSNRPYTNAYDVLPTLIGKQWELGVKTNLDGLLLSANYYWIEKSNTFDIDNPDGTLTRSQDGKQRHHGFELSAAGRLGDCLTLYGGLTFIDAKVSGAALADQQGARPTGVPRFLAKLYAEYEVPRVAGLFVTGGVVYMGNRRVVTSNSDRRTLSGYAVWDAGLRYERTIGGVETIARLNVENIGDRRYWSSTDYILGDPRTVTFSLSVRF